MITTLLGELQAITWFLQKGKAVQILNWRESNLPLEKKHRTVALFTSIRYIYCTTGHKISMGPV